MSTNIKGNNKSQALTATIPLPVRSSPEPSAMEPRWNSQQSLFVGLVTIPVRGFFFPLNKCSGVRHETMSLAANQEPAKALRETRKGNWNLDKYDGQARLSQGSLICRDLKMPVNPTESLFLRCRNTSVRFHGEQMFSRRRRIPLGIK